MPTMKSAWAKLKYVDGRLVWRRSGRCAGYLSKAGYTQVWLDGRLDYAHRLIFLMFWGYLPEQVDHRNGDRTDNRIENLRPASNMQNQYNRRIGETNTSGFKGVYWHKQRQKWHAEIRADGRKRSLGLHDTAEAAAKAYDDASRLLHGEYARNNST